MRSRDFRGQSTALLNAPKVRFVCGAAEPFIAWEILGWLARSGVDTASPVIVEVLHPDREMDGSCRWCGGRKDETVTVNGGRLA